MANGIIKYDSDTKKFRFIDQDGGPDTAVQHSNTNVIGIESSKAGRRVTSKLTQGKQGLTTVKEIRENLLISKAELARKAGLSPLTIDRVENGMGCRMDTKRKIILALGYDLSNSSRIFSNDQG